MHSTAWFLLQDLHRCCSPACGRLDRARPSGCSFADGQSGGEYHHAGYVSANTFVFGIDEWPFHHGGLIVGSQGVGERWDKRSQHCKKQRYPKKWINTMRFFLYGALPKCMLSRTDWIQVFGTSCMYRADRQKGVSFKGPQWLQESMSFGNIGSKTGKHCDGKQCV